MIHFPLCPCGTDYGGPGDARAHEWIVGDAVMLRLMGESVVRISDLHFGQFARWKYMGQRRRWAKLIRPALVSEMAFNAGQSCIKCQNDRWRVFLNRKGKEYRRLCRNCGERRSVAVYRVRGPRQRQWDEANLVAACRPVIDSLVERGYLVDDGPQWMKATYNDRHKADISETIIVISKEAA